MLKAGSRLANIRTRLACQIPNGFELVKTSTVDDLKLDLTEMNHTASGARWIHINKPSEKQKVFNICFRTVPMTDNGVAHILEHIALCGSSKYPVRDPFFKMINRSLNNFMNAMTGTDYTMYPFSTMNEKDFQNLLSVYLDAVFRPNLRYLDFLQEAWRIGEGDEESGMVFKGVVFNEMKGAMADREQIFFRRLIAAMAPSGTYGYNSGGEPLDIPSLTYEELKKFHADHYNPANSQILTYGDLDIQKTSAQIAEALNSVPAGHVSPSIEPEPRWTEPKHVTFACPWNESASDPEKQSTASVCWTVCDRADAWANFLGSIIGSLLCDGPSSPLYKQLIESGLGSEFSTGTGFIAYLKDSLFSAGLKDAKISDLDKIHKLVIEGIENACNEGFPQDRIDALIHQYELTTRHQSTQFGLNLTFGLHSALLHGADPNESLQTIKLVERLKSELNSDPEFLVKETRKMLLENNSRVLLKMIPDQEYDNEQNKLEDKMLKEHLSKLSPEEMRECQDIELDMEREQMETPDVTCLPTVLVSDIPTKKQYFVPNQVHDRIHYQPTQGSGLTYIRGMIELENLTPEEISLLPVYESVLTSIGRGGYDYRQIGVQEDLASAGFKVATGIQTDHMIGGVARPVINFSTYGLDSKLERILELLDPLLVADGPEFSPDRIKTVLNEVFSSVQGGVVGSGHVYSMAHSHSYVNAYGSLNEQINGLTAIQTLKEMINSNDWENVSQKLKTLHAKVSSSYLRLLLHADEDSSDLFTKLSGFNRSSSSPSIAGSSTETQVHRSTWDLGFPINFVSRALPTVPSGHPDAAPLRVCAALMGSKYLLREIREAGGAYGAGAQQSGEAFRFFSYRDPSGLGTLSKFSNSVQWVLDQSWESRDVDEAILKVFQSVDTPTSQSSRGVSIWKSGLTPDDLETNRQRLLGVTSDDIIRVANDYLAMNLTKSDCIIGPISAEIQQFNDPNSDINQNLDEASTQKWKTFKL